MFFKRKACLIFTPNKLYMNICSNRRKIIVDKLLSFDRHDDVIYEIANYLNLQSNISKNLFISIGMEEFKVHKLEVENKKYSDSILKTNIEVFKKKEPNKIHRVLRGYKTDTQNYFIISLDVNKVNWFKEKIKSVGYKPKILEMNENLIIHVVRKCEKYNKNNILILSSFGNFLNIIYYEKFEVKLIKSFNVKNETEENMINLIKIIIDLHIIDSNIEYIFFSGENFNENFKTKIKNELKRVEINLNDISIIDNKTDADISEVIFSAGFFI